MTQNTWLVTGVDAETRQHAAEMAERLGVSLADYLTEALLENSAPAPSPGLDAVRPFTAQKPRENLALRHRLEALERRLSLSTGGLDNAIAAIDSSVFSLAARLDETETIARHASDGVQAGLADLAGRITSARNRIAEGEVRLGTLAHANDEAHAAFAEHTTALEHRVETIEDVAKAARQASATLAEAHNALKHAVADEFTDLGRHTAEQLASGLETVRAEAQRAAAEADAAFNQLLGECISFRETVEDRITESAAETRGRMQASFADITGRLSGLTERVVKNDNTLARTADLLRAEIADAQDASRAALAETTNTLRQAQAALAQETIRTAETHQTLLSNVRAGLTNEIAVVRDRQAAGEARLAVVEGSATDHAAVLTALRQAIDALEVAANASTAGLDAKTTHVHRVLSGDIARVEACTMAALEKLSADIASGDELSALQAEASVNDAAARIDELRSRLECELADLRGQHAGAVARLQLIDRTLGNLGEAAAAPVLDRISSLERECRTQATRLDGAAERAPTEQALAILGKQVAALGARVAGHSMGEMAHTLAELRGQLATQQEKASRADQRVDSIALTLDSAKAQIADANVQSRQRLDNLEYEVSGLRREFLPAPAALEEVQDRLTQLERRQAETLETLRDDIEQFTTENQRRLAEIEAGASAAPLLESMTAALNDRLAMLESRDLAADFESLRQRLEDRMLGVEIRGVRTLEQLGETIALIERRFAGEADQKEALSA